MLENAGISDFNAPIISLSPGAGNGFASGRTLRLAIQNLNLEFNGNSPVGRIRPLRVVALNPMWLDTLFRLITIQMITS